MFVLFHVLNLLQRPPHNQKLALFPLFIIIFVKYWLKIFKLSHIYTLTLILTEIITCSYHEHSAFSRPCPQKFWHWNQCPVQQYCVFGRFKGVKVIFDESLVSAWQLHKLHLCLPSSITSCTPPRPSKRTQRQTLFRCSLNSAAPLTLYLYTSCTQTLNKVNTQGSTLNTK